LTTGLTTGRVLQFDQVRGYGFVAADDDGDDVFLHTSVFDGDPDELIPGTKVEFKVMAGDRGRKAFAARLIDDEPEEGVASPPRLVPPPRPVPPPQSAAGPRPVGAPFPPAAPPGPAPAPTAPKAGTAPGPRDPEEDLAPDEDGTCDVLSPAEFSQELTELLLSNAPTLTGQQILEVRRSLLESAGKHGWVDL
jgi:cold shock protein